MDITPAPGGAQGDTGATGAAGAGGATGPTGATGAGGTPVPTALWAARGTGSIGGEQKLITDVGPLSGTLMTWDAVGSRWLIRNRTRIITDLVSATAGSNTNDNLLKANTIPVGLLMSASGFVVQVLFAKNNTTAAATAITIRLGTLGTIADPVIASLATFASGNRSIAMGPSFAIISSTVVRMLGNQAGSSEFTGGGSATTYPQNVTVEDMDANALIMSASIQMSSSATLGQVGHMLVELLP